MAFKGLVRTSSVPDSVCSSPCGPPGWRNETIAVAGRVLIYLHKDIEALYVVTPFAAVVLGYLGNSVFFSFVTAKKPASVVMASGDNGSREAIWFEKFSDFPQQGDETKLYYDASTDEYYYWTGTMYARWVGPRPPKPPKPPL